jgi:alpha-ribazole phosphatase
VKKKLLLLRHAEHKAARYHQFVGSTDIALSEQGRRQAIAVIPFIEKHRPCRCFCSPLSRCLETIQSLPGLSVDIDPDLREVDFGAWEGKTFDQIQLSDPEAVNRWAKFDPAFSFPGGEQLEEFLLRVQKVAAAIVSCREDTILAVTHAGVIRALLCHFLGLHPRQYVLFNVDYASLTILELFGDKGVLTGLNYPCISGDIKWDKSSL